MDLPLRGNAASGFEPGACCRVKFLVLYQPELISTFNNAARKPASAINAPAPASLAAFLFPIAAAVSPFPKLLRMRSPHAEEFLTHVLAAVIACVRTSVLRPSLLAVVRVHHLRICIRVPCIMSNNSAAQCIGTRQYLLEFGVTDSIFFSSDRQAAYHRHQRRAQRALTRRQNRRRAQPSRKQVLA